MKAAGGSLITLLNTAQQFVAADLYTWTLVDGTVVRYTSADINLTVGGNTFNAGGLPGNPIFARDEIKTVLGVQVDDLKVTVSAGAADLIGGTAWLAAVVKGKFDGATLLLEQFISDSWTNVAVGKLYGFFGRVAGIDVDRAKAIFTIKAPLELLDLNLPRNQYSAGCWHTVYDAGCTLTKSNYTVNGAVNDGAPTTTSFKTNLATVADGFYSLGVIAFTSGVLNGFRRRVQNYVKTNGVVTVVPPLSSPPGNGDTFTIYPGCDKLQGTCGASANIVFTASGSTLSATAHGLTNGQAVQLSTTGALPAPLATGTIYFVCNAAANTFQLATTLLLALAGTNITLTNAGSGTNSVSQSGKFGNLPNFGGHPYIPVPDKMM